MHTLDKSCINLLIVEDYEDDLLILKHHLKSVRNIRFQIRHATSIGEALRILDSDSIDLVLLDLSLPGSRGLTTFKPIAGKVAQKTPIIVLTSAHDPDLISRLLNEGAQDYLVKDEMGPAVLAKSIHYSLERFQFQIANAALHQSLSATENELLQVAKLEALSRLAVGLVHQLKNPLGVLAFGIDFFRKRSTKDPLAEEIADRMHRNLDRADNLISDLLDLSTAAEYHPEECDLSTLLRDAVKMIEHRLSTDEGSIRLAFAESSTEITISADRRKLQQAVINLLDNAIEAIERPTEGRIELSARVDATSSQVLISVSDNGSGISSGDLPNVTDPFFSTKQEKGGTGLGLSLVRRTASLHGGSFQIETTGMTTSATISLPLEPLTKPTLEPTSYASGQIENL